MRNKIIIFIISLNQKNEIVSFNDLILFFSFNEIKYLLKWHHEKSDLIKYFIITILLSLGRKNVEKLMINLYKYFFD